MTEVLDLYAGPGGDPSECWTGLGYDNGNGYRRIGADKIYVHRLSYETYIGPIPVGMVIDHLCRNRGCWNPAHLEAVSNEENILRGVSPPARNASKDSCPRCGGEYVQHKDGRRCLPCKQDRRTDTIRKGVGRAGDRTHCPQGHEYNDINTFLAYKPDGSIRQRVCRECGRQSVRRRRAAARLEVSPK